VRCHSSPWGNFVSRHWLNVLPPWFGLTASSGTSADQTMHYCQGSCIQYYTAAPLATFVAYSALLPAFHLHRRPSTSWTKTPPNSAVPCCPSSSPPFMVCPYFVAVCVYACASGYPFLVISGVPYGLIESPSLDGTEVPAEWRLERLRMYKMATPANAMTASPPTTLPAITDVLFKRLLPPAG